MSVTDRLPTSGYLLERLYTSRQVFEQLEPSEELPGLDEADIAYGWNWRCGEEDRFEVSISLVFEPSRERAERIAILLTGLFQRIGEDQTVVLLEFVRYHAPSILMPYAREAVSALASRGPNGPHYLAPLNVAEIMRSIDPTNSTGFKQLQNNKDLAGRFGVDMRSLEVEHTSAS